MKKPVCGADLATFQRFLVLFLGVFVHGVFGVVFVQKLFKCFFVVS